MTTLVQPALDELVEQLQREGIAPPDTARWPRVELHAVSPTLVADDPALALATPLDWVRAQLARGPSEALVMGLVGHGLASRRWRLGLATPALVLMVELVLPLVGDDARASLEACSGSLKLVGRALEAAATHRGERVALIATDLDGAAAEPASQWAGLPATLPPQPLVWLRLFDLLQGRNR